MTPLELLLIEKGYKRYRKSYHKGVWKYTENNKGYSFSTMVSGELDYRYVKDENFEKEIIFGLNEVHKPPTLVWPRPKGITQDDDMNRLLKQKTSEEIYNLIVT